MSIRLSHCTIDLEGRRVLAPDGETSLSPLEAGLLRYLAARPGQLVGREELLVEVWGYAPGVRSRAVDKTITRLRRKLEIDPAHPVHLLSAYGGGYGLVVPEPGDRSEGRGFVGRQAELADARQRLESRGQLTLVGPPGVGKTTMVRQLCGTVGAQMLFCDLRRAQTAAEVHVAVSQALGIALSSAGDVERLERCLDARPDAVLVLDNTEQLDASGDAAVARLCGGAGRVLVAARRPVGFAGECTLRLQTLPMDDARELFCRRAREVRPGILLKTEEVDRLVESLDGLPLAIELAAARVRVTEVAQLSTLLEQRFSLLREGELDLSRSLAWSWDLLEPHEQSALCQLSVMEGAFDFETADAVVDLSPWPRAPWTMDVLGRLVEHSLVQVLPADGRARFQLLESIRAFARDRLGASERTATEGRHLDCFARWSAERMARRFGRRGLDSRQRLASCRAELEVAFERASGEQALAIADALDLLLQTMGPVDQRHRLWSRIPLEGLSRESRAHILCRRGEAGLRGGRPKRALQDLEAALELAPSQVRGQVVAVVGAAHLLLGQVDRAESLLKEALELLDEGAADESARAEFIARGNLGTVAWLRGELDAAESHYSEALAFAREAGDIPSQALGLGWLSGLHVQRGSHQRARQVLVQAEEACRAVDNRVGELVAVGNRGVVALECGEYQCARSDFDWAVDRARVLGERRLEGLFLGNLAVLDLLLGAEAQAADRFSAAIATQACRGGDLRMEAYLQAWRAVAQRTVVGSEAARAAIAQARVRLEALDDRSGIVLTALCEAMLDPSKRATAVAMAQDPGRGRCPPLRGSSDVRVALQLLDARRG